MNNDSPKEIKLLKVLINDSYSEDCGLVNTFTIFKSINNIFYLIYPDRNSSIICYNLMEETKICHLKKAHKQYITNIKHCLDEKNYRDIIMSISHKDNNIKLWNFHNWECLSNIINVNNSGLLFSGSFLNYQNKKYIITSNLDWKHIPEPIKIFDFNGIKIKEINNSNNNTLFIDTFYDYKSSKIYIIASSENYIKSYDYNDNKLYKIYYESNNGNHKSFILFLIYLFQNYLNNIYIVDLNALKILYF